MASVWESRVPEPVQSSNEEEVPQSPDLAEIARSAGLERIHMVAWRDLDDPEAGGSELHAHRVASAWAGAGLEVTLRTSAVAGLSAVVERDGYTADRRSGRYGVFSSVAFEGFGRASRSTPIASADGLVEIWNGMPFFSPLWFRGPRVVFLHHVHDEMWGMVLPGMLARLGRIVESRVAPPVYRRTQVVTLSESSRREIVSMLGLRSKKVSVVPPGVEARFSPGGRRSPDPLVVAVGRLVPVKRFDLLFDVLARVREEVPRLQAVVIGEGYERPRLEAARRECGGEGWIHLLGHLEDEQVVEWYRSAWVLASASLREGWGMTITEAGACGTPAVVTRIAGHEDAVAHGSSGLLADDAGGLADGLRRVLQDERLRASLGHGALEHARGFTWAATARGTLEALAAAAGSHGSRRGGDPGTGP